MLAYTQLKDHNRHNLIDIIPLKKPFTLLIEPSNYCNFKCVSCFQSLNNDNYLARNRGMMDMRLYREIIRQFQKWEGDKLKVLKLSLYGEPLTNPNFGEMLHVAQEAQIAERIETTTNASLLTEELCQQFVRYNIDYIRVSIYGGNQARYEQVTGCKNVQLDQIIYHLKLLQEIKKRAGKDRPFVSVKMLDTYTEENEEFLCTFRPVSDEVYIDKPHNWVAPDNENFIGGLYTAEQQAALAKDLAQTKAERIACPMPFTTLAVRSNGDVSPCCVDWSGGTNLGNIWRKDIRTIWNGEAMYQFRKMQLENRRRENVSCAHCELVNNGYYTRDNIDGFPVDRLR